MTQNTLPFSTELNVHCVRAFALILFFSSFSLAQETQKKGEIIDTVAVSTTSNESFSLYLPSSYNETKPSPIIFVFEPAARGRTGLLPFVESAEKHGIILVCSNNSRNGPFEKSFAIADNLFKHVFKNYTIDVAQMYLSGFSGGSRLATTIAVLSGQFAGVIACGAGFSPNPSHRPTLYPFLYAAICGVEDMNYQELLHNKKYLTKLNFKNTLFSFDGGHRWPNKREVTRAVDWLFLQNQNKNNVRFPKDSITQSFLADYELTQLFLENNELLFAKENYERALKTYPEAMGLDSIRTKHADLINSKPFKLASKKRSEALEQEEKIKKKLFTRLQSDLNADKEINFKWWEKEVEKLNQIEQKGHKEIKRMVSRIKYGIIAAVYERSYVTPPSSKNTNNNLVKTFRKILYRTP